MEEKVIFYYFKKCFSVEIIAQILGITETKVNQIIYENEGSEFFIILESKMNVPDE